MISNLLIINGSPRGEKSLTMKITNSFIEGLKQINKELNVQTIVLKEQNIQTCRGCFACWQSSQGECIIRDDMKDIMEKYLMSDLIIWSFPLYHFGMPAIVKAFHERTLPMVLPFIDRHADGSCTHPVRDERFKNKKHVVISSCGFCSVNNNYEALTKHLDILMGESCEKVYCVEGELLGQAMLTRATQPYIEAVKQAGIEYASSGRISDHTRQILSYPFVEENSFIDMANASWGIEDKRNSKPGEHSFETLKAYGFMSQMSASFNPEAKRNLNAVLEINYTDINETYQLVMKNNECKMLVGAELVPTTTIKTTIDTWKKIAEGSLNGPQAMMDGKYQVSGDFNLMLVLEDLFGGKKTYAESPTGQNERKGKRKSQMILFLLPWIIFWVISPFNMLYGSLSAVVSASIVAAFGDIKWELTIYERLNPLVLSCLLITIALNIARLQLVIVSSYLLFAFIWIISSFIKIPFTCWYSRYGYGENILSNPLFIKTNRILTFLWGLLYIFTAMWTYFLALTPVFTFIGLINSIAPIFMGLFTTWFAKRYPATVAKGA